MVIGDKTYPVQMQDHDAAKDFIKRLLMTLTFENLGTIERIADLKSALTLGNAPRSTASVTGDLPTTFLGGVSVSISRTSRIHPSWSRWVNCPHKPPKP